MKFRFAFSALCMLVAMTMATDAIAQGVFRVTSGTESRGRATGHAEKAGDISLFGIDGEIEEDESGVVMIEYGVPITNAVGPLPAAVEDVVTDNNINITICGTDPTRIMGDEADGTEGTTAVNRASVSKDGSMLTISIESCGTDEVIEVRGVLLSLVGSGQDSITATVTNTGDVRLLSNETQVIRSVVDPLSDDEVSVKPITVIRHSGDIADNKTDDYFNLVIAEAHLDSFTGARLELEFSGIPEGVTVTLDSWLTGKANFDLKSTDSDRTPPTAGQNKTKIDPVTVDSEDGEVTITLEGTPIDEVVPVGEGATIPAVLATMLDPRALDVIIVRGQIAIDEKMVDFPIDLSIQATVNLGPIGALKTKAGDTVQIPRFASNKTAAMTVIESTSATNTFLVPYALLSRPLGGYDTGFSIANTTSGDDAQIGSVTFSFPGDATLDDFESEMVGPGQNLTILLSDILGATSLYSGQVMITTNFTDAEGVAYISNFLTFTSASPLLKQ